MQNPEFGFCGNKIFAPKSASKLICDSVDTGGL